MLVFQGSLIADNTIVFGGIPELIEDTLQSDPTGITILNGGVLNNQGTVILSGNLDNQNIFINNLGAGTISMSDTIPQIISGQNIIGRLMLGNSAGVNLGGHTILTGALAFNSGLLTLGSNNLLLGTDAIVEGTPSAMSMVIATGSGELRKSFPGAGSFTFPVGDTTGVAEYSPVTLLFEGGSYNSGNYAGVHLVDSVYPGAMGSYISRYWDVSQSGITGFSCNAAFRYLPADLSGAGEKIRCLRVTPDSVEYFNENNADSGLLIADSLTIFGTFSGLQQMVSRRLNLTLFLESLYNGSGTMRQAQNGSGPQFTGSTADQISIELHDAANYAAKVLTLSNIALSTSGSATVTLPGLYNGSYYITVRHRNSIETTTAAPVSFAMDTIDYSFDLPARVFGSNLQMMSDGQYAIYGGDVDQDGAVDTGDATPVDNDAAAFVTGYVATDVNGDASVDSADGTIIDNNSAAFVSVKIP